VIGAYHRRAAAVIARAGGFVATYTGDSVLAYFGDPRADKHDAERAVRAGLALVEAIAPPRRPPAEAGVPGVDTAAGMPLQLRVGIATGLVVVGDLTGERDAGERDVVGETPNLAARLQALAEPGSVVIAAATRRLLDLTPQKQKDKTLRAPVDQVEGLAARQPVRMLFEDTQWSAPTSLELFDLIIDRTNGVPLFVEELTKGVVESGMLTDSVTMTQWRGLSLRWRYRRRCRPRSWPGSIGWRRCRR
jgi:Adenylate and Guanylate cyclase catalytic domain